MAVPETIISEIGDIHRIRRDHWKGHFIYRGEASTSYTLRPKFGRHLAAPWDAGGGQTFPTRAHETALLDLFKRRAPPFLERYPTDDWEWLALAQHHGLATRLLDWTTNILVAAFFACGGPEKADAVIYALDTANISSAPARSPFSIKDDVVFHPHHTTPRIAAQSGLFTSHVEPERPFAPTGLQRIVLPQSLLIDLEATLATYDVDAARLFPGLDSLAKNINGKFACR